MAENQFRLFSHTEQTKKTCTHCAISKPISEFALRYIGPRGPHYKSKCASCTLEYEAKWRTKNKAKLNARRRELYKQDERYKSHARGWYQRNKSYFVRYRDSPTNRQRERVNERQRIAHETPEQRQKRLLCRKRCNEKTREARQAYRQSVKERTAETRKLWLQNNPEKRAEHEMKRRARKMGVPIEKIDRAAIIQRDKSTCYLCGQKLELNEIHLEHVIPLARGGTHTAANLKVACAPCNYAKARYTPDEYLALCAESH